MTALPEVEIRSLADFEAAVLPRHPGALYRGVPTRIQHTLIPSLGRTSPLFALQISVRVIDKGRKANRFICSLWNLQRSESADIKVGIA